MQKQLEPLLTWSRSVRKYYDHHPDAYNSCVEDAKGAKVHFESYAAETPTRWSSTLACLESAL
eukprot:4619675-Karenia_brevis.AAC.1